jgi:Transcriptional regulators
LVNTNMRLAHHLLRHRSGAGHFRLTVPRDLHAALGLRIIKKSLGTHDPVTARAWAYVLSARYALIFAKALSRGTAMATDSNGEREQNQNTRPLPREIKLRTGSGNEPVDYCCEIRADGSKRIEADGPEDHERAMAAWAEMEKTPHAGLTQKVSKPEPDASALASAIETLGLSLTQSRAGITKQAISQLVRELEARGYVEQVPDSTDTRAKIVRLTNRGVALHAACAE